MKLTLQRKILAAFLILSTGIIITGIITYRKSALYRDTNELVQHTQVVLYQSEQVLSVIKDIATASRGFIITGNSVFLDSFAQSKNMVFKGITELKKLTKDNPKQQARIDILSRLVQRRIEFSDSSNAMRAKQGFSAASNLILTGEGEYYMKAISDLIGEIQQQENDLLLKRQQQNTDNLTDFNRLFYLLMAGTLIVLILFIVFIFHNLRVVNKTNSRLKDEVSERKKTEDALKQSHGQLQQLLNKIQLLLETSFDVICIIDESGRFVQVSATSKKLFRYEPEEMIGHKYIEFVQMEDRPATEVTVEKIMGGLDISYFENRCCRRDGSCIPVIWAATWSPENKLMYCIARNGSEKKQTMEQIKKYAEELKRSNVELQQFAYVASHDLQEPLRMVSSFLQLLEKKYKDSLDPTAQQYIYFAVDGAERMKRLILDLLTYSRVGSSNETFGSTDMNAIANEVIRTFKPALQETGGDVIVHKLPVINAVKTQMLQLVQNLVGNAVKYRDSRPPKIEIWCREQSSEWEFHVKDNGIGISEQYFDKVFVIFQRLHTKANYAGTGIGLAVCKKIVERHNGTIRVESKLGEGSTFIFTIKKQFRTSDS